ncbi:hypothetical protein RUMLAC_01992 [[Ruminococcus] lactaris ATCC 29176]|uniref:Uncharacterized protein n=1 Tax=[Ruminococcus] lactaris ATCC 29176 TaxID=471875 RepID=B5CR91_9FIRM|nr:hypothetical protein RUMLAC_01992 [[Ruminococcus] lactaris ATCC 29176]
MPCSPFVHSICSAKPCICPLPAFSLLFQFYHSFGRKEKGSSILADDCPFLCAA